MREDNNVSIPLLGLKTTHLTSDNYGSTLETQHHENDEHAITITADDIKEETISESQPLNTIGSVVVYYEGLQKSMSLIQTALDTVRHANQITERRQRCLARLTWLTVELISAGALGGLGYGCYQVCRESHGLEMALTVGMCLFGTVVFLCGLLGADFYAPCFTRKDAAHFFSPVEKAQLRPYLMSVDLDGPQEFWQLYSLLRILTKQTHYLDSIVQAYQSRLALLMCFKPQPDNCTLYRSFFRNRLMDKNLVRLIFEMAGIEAASFIAVSDSKESLIHNSHPAEDNEEGNQDNRSFTMMST